MTISENYVVFPEGGCQEVSAGLAIDELVDLNGHRLYLPLTTARMIAYRVVKIRGTEERGVRAIYHYLELVPAFELMGYAKNR